MGVRTLHIMGLALAGVIGILTMVQAAEDLADNSVLHLQHQGHSQVKQQAAEGYNMVAFEDLVHNSELHLKYQNHSQVKQQEGEGYNKQERIQEEMMSHTNNNYTRKNGYNIADYYGQQLKRRERRQTGGRCGGELVSSWGTIKHPDGRSEYRNNEDCVWIIKPSHRMRISITKLNTEKNWDVLAIHDGTNTEAGLLGRFSGDLSDFTTTSVITTGMAAYINFTSDDGNTKTGFELHWEPLVETFYYVDIGSDYEIKLNFDAIPEPTSLKWSYGPSFHDMPNIIQTPSENRKFSTSLIHLQDNKYEAVLKITGITEEDIETKFKLHVQNNSGETYYHIRLSGSPHPPSNVHMMFILRTKVRVAWDHWDNQRSINYMIKFKPKQGQFNYTEVSGTDKMQHTLIGLTPSTEYVLYVVAIDELSREMSSEPTYFKTEPNYPSCGEELFTSSSGKLRYPVTGDMYKYYERCAWLIMPNERIKLTFKRFNTMRKWDYLYLRDGTLESSSLLGMFHGNLNNGSFPSTVATTGTAMHLLFIACDSSFCDGPGFELQWEPAVETFYDIDIGSDYEVRLNFTADPEPTSMKWFYGPNFNDMDNIIQIPSNDNGKFSASLINLHKNKYQAVLKITGTTQEDIDTKFKLHVTSRIGDTYYRAQLSAFSAPPSNVRISKIRGSSIKASWDYTSGQSGLNTSYVIKYKSIIDNLTRSISGITNNSYTITDLVNEYEVQVSAETKLGIGPPSEPVRVATKCGGILLGPIGKILHPFQAQGRYNHDDNERCTWIIKTNERITLRFIRFKLQSWNSGDYFGIWDGTSKEIGILDSFKGIVANSVTTSAPGAYIHYRQEWPPGDSGFELTWEPAVETFYNADIGSDYEVQLNFTVNPEPTSLKWSYGPSFIKMPNYIQIPIYSRKFSTSLTDFGENRYQAVLKISGITQVDMETKFKLHVTNELGDAYYRASLSGYPGPPSNIKISNILGSTVRVSWEHNESYRDISHYIIHYKQKNTEQNYTKIAGVNEIKTTLTELMPSTEYFLHVAVVYSSGQGPLSVETYFKTDSCGGEFLSSSGMFRYPKSGDGYGVMGNGPENVNCIWLIMSNERITLTINKFNAFMIDYLDLRDGELESSELLGSYTGRLVNGSFPSSVTTTTTSMRLHFHTGYELTLGGPGFELHWEPAVKMFYNVDIGSDYEIQLNLTVDPAPTSLKWSYGPSFSEMPHIIQIPSDNGKFASSLIDLEDNKYQVVFKITRVIKEDIETKFKLHVTNELGETFYRVKLSGFPSPPSNVQISSIQENTANVTWEYEDRLGSISSFTVQYRLRNSDSQYTEIAGLSENQTTLEGLTHLTEYVLRVVAVYKSGRGLQSEPIYFKTGCPSGFFNINDRSECYKVLFESGKSNWTEAGARCKKEGLSLAQPPHVSAMLLREYVLHKYGDMNYVWIGARRVPFEQYVVWQQPWESEGQQLFKAPKSAMWHSMYSPDTVWKGWELEIVDSLCVNLRANKWEWGRHPTHSMYGLMPCAAGMYPLCQAFDPDTL